MILDLSLRGSEPLRRLARWAGWMIGLSLVFHSSAYPQENPVSVQIHGVLLSEEDQTPVGEAIVRLLGPAGAQLDVTLSTSRGEFRLETSASGPFVLQVSRLGFQPWSRESLDVLPGEPLTLSIAIPVLPISLPDLEVGGERTCDVPIEEARQAFFLYEAARPILRSIADAERGDEYRYQVQVVSESSDRGRAVYDTTVAVVMTPVETDSPAALMSHGYLRAPNETTRLYLTPNARVLASEEFEDTHCFGINIDKEGQRFGLEFKPRRDRTVSDIKGVLWYSYVDMRPTSMEFTYTGVSSFLEEHELPALENRVRSRVDEEGKNRRISVGHVQLNSDFGGMLRFEPIAENLWITREWELRYPIVDYRVSWQAGGRTGGRPSVEIRTHTRPRTKITTVLAVLGLPRH